MGSAPHFAPASPTSPLDVVRLLRSGGNALLVQALLHGQLAHVEWQVEKNRLQRLLATGLLGFACLLCVLLFAGALATAATWHTAWRLPVVAGLLLLYVGGTAVAWHRFTKLAALGDDAFAASHEELALDAALLKRSL